MHLGALELTPTSLIQVDGGGSFDQSAPNGQGAGVNLRRGRIGGIASVAEIAKATVIWDFGGTPGHQSALYQADLAYAGASPLVARAGVFKAPFTLEFAQGASSTLFLERSTIDTLVAGLVGGGGRVGAQLGATGERWFASLFFTGGKTGPGARSGQRAVLGRVAGLIVKSDTLSINLGASGAWLFRVANAADGARTLTLSDQPEISLDMAPASLSSGAVPASGAKLGGLEAGLTWNRVWLQAEGYAITLDGTNGLDRSRITRGGYLQGSYTLLGRPRQWLSNTAAWGSPTPEGAWGAVEAGARVSYADVAGLAGDGGRQTVLSTDLSWYPVAPLRFTLEYGHARIQGGAASRSLDFVAVRSQIGF